MHIIGFLLTFIRRAGHYFASISLFPFLQAHSLSFGASFYLLHILVYSLSKFRLSFFPLFPLSCSIKSTATTGKSNREVLSFLTLVSENISFLGLVWFESTKRFMIVAAWTSQEILLTSLTFNEFFLLLSILTNLHVFWC